MFNFGEYVHEEEDESDNKRVLVWIPNVTLRHYMDKGLLSNVNENSIFHCVAKGIFMHIDSILDKNILLPGGISENIETPEFVDVKLEFFNQVMRNDNVIVNNGLATFDDIKKYCEQTLYWGEKIPIVGWKVNGKDVDGSEKVFDHIVSSDMTIEAVIENLKNINE